MALQFPDIDPVALSLGPLEIRWYALAYLAGFLLGWRYALFLAGKDEGKGQAITKTQIDDFLPWGIMGVIFGGRLGYVLFYQTSYFMQNPLEIFKIWHGGMSFHGGVLGMMVAMAAYSWHGKSSLLRLTDLVSCAAPIGLFFGRLANFVNGELFGRATDAPWGMVFPRGGEMPRHPSQLYEAVLEGLVLFGVLALLARKESLRNKPGVLTGIFLMGYGLARVIVEFFREPDIQLGLIADAVTMGQILSVPMVLCGLILFFYAGRKQAVS
ncbi:MAG: prolipoprotein diacylglyceryl transferase [Rhodospirillales bacterium]|nr:prolipoprotein diacylglyceryl transferase [Rhodospirillales bacterium]MCB9995438.1 prolipoprotein diacylglyceryl transferase [Rhodospirillales bacterium]